MCMLEYEPKVQSEACWRRLARIIDVGLVSPAPDRALQVDGDSRARLDDLHRCHVAIDPDTDLAVDVERTTAAAARDRRKLARNLGQRARRDKGRCARPLDW